MKIIRKDEVSEQVREDGRRVMDYLSLNVNFKTENVGLIKAFVPKNCKEKEHRHTRTDVICFYLTDGIIKVNSKEYEMKSGDVLILHAGDRHHQVPRNNDIELIEIKVPDDYDKIYTEDEESGERD